MMKRMNAVFPLLVVAAAVLVAMPIDAACKTCTPQSECVTTENAAFCSCEEKIWGQAQRCLIKAPLCMATGTCCCGGPDDIRVETMDRDIPLSASALRSIIADHPHLGHALDSAVVSSLDSRSDANLYGNAKRVALSTDWIAGVVSGMADVEDFIFSMELDPEGDGARFMVTIRRYDRATLRESLEGGTFVDHIEGYIDAGGATVTAGGETRTWSAP